MLPTTTQALPPVLDTAGVAKLLGLNARTVLLMARDGRLPARRVPGGRKYQFLTEEVLSALATEDGPTDDHGPSSLATPSSGTDVITSVFDVDPCDVWGAAPVTRGTGWAARCLEHWLTLAADAGLGVACVAPPSLDTAGPCVGVVAIDDLTYRVLTGPRKRTRLLDDDGEIRWSLIDAVWAEPVLDHDAAGRAGATALSGAFIPSDATR